MSDSNHVVTSAAVGALVGALAAYFVFTAQGRTALARVDPTLDDLSQALQEFRRALRRADGVVQEARGAVDDVRAIVKGDDLSVRV